MALTIEWLKAFILFPIRYLYYLRRAEIEKDAEINVDTCAARTRAILGGARAFDSVTEPEHAALAQDVNTDSVIEECKADLVAQERERAKHWPMWILVPALAFAFLIEAVSCVQIFAGVGVAMPERALFGGGVAVGVFLLLFFTVEHADLTIAEVAG